jgi:hypothetical protein
MKLISIAHVIVTAGSIAAASPSHRHHHAHIFKRQPNNVKVVTVNEYVVNGQTQSLDAVCAGIRSGTLRLSDGSDSLPECETNNGTDQKVAKPDDSTPVILESPSVEAAVVPDSTPVPEPAEPGKSRGKRPNMPSNKSSYKPSDEAEESAPFKYEGKGLDREFPNNEIDCSTFPSEYGPIPIEWAEQGGWSDIQYVTQENGFITEVHNGIKGSRCKPGAMCSYACPPGWQKTQWPTIPAIKGRSVGGLSCNENNKLELTNPDLSTSLCMKGTGATKVENKLSSKAVICRTDYPGTEKMIVPLETKPGTISELTCPDSNRYYKHLGMPTTAQYYINNKGVPKEDACRWGSRDKNQGNWAPSVLGAGKDLSGKTFISIFATTDNLEPALNYQPLDYCVEIVPEDDSELSGTCRLCNGKYCFTNREGSTECNDRGCTVGIIRGTARYVLTDS